MNEINNIIDKAIAEINCQLDSELQLEHIDDELLASEGSKLDSLALLSFIAVLEENTSEYGIDFMDIVMSGDENKIFQTIGSLKQFLAEIKG